MDQARRFWQNQDAKACQKQEMYKADSAVDNWQEHKDPSGFPEVRAYLARKTSNGSWESYTISGWGHERRSPLTKDQYAEMKAAYLKTEAGKADNWKMQSTWL